MGTMTEDRASNIAQAFRLEEVGVQSGNQTREDIVGELYEKVRPSLLVYVYQMVGSTSDAEDLVQIAFLKLFDHLSGKREVSNLRSWLYRVAHNLAIDQIRQVDRRSSLIQEWFPDGVTLAIRESAEEELVRRQQIESALEMLNDRERSCLMLRADGLSYKEVSEVLGISAKSVSVYLARGLKKFEVNIEKTT
jgi:RNA polymerase sigma-70 factor (ECF subfamily)